MLLPYGWTHACINFGATIGFTVGTCTHLGFHICLVMPRSVVTALFMGLSNQPIDTCSAHILSPWLC